MRYTVIFGKSLSPSTFMTLPPAVESSVNRFSHRVMGGCDQASISLRGPRNQLFECHSLIGLFVRIYDTRGVLVWWGYVKSVETRYGAHAAMTSIGEVANKVAALYTWESPRSYDRVQGSLTSWAEDTFSQEQYGVLEQILRVGRRTSSEALSLRDAYLSKFSRHNWSTTTGESEGGSFSALVSCSGLSTMLTRRYYTKTHGELENPNSGSGAFLVGNGSPQVTELGQRILSVGTDIESVLIRMRRYIAGGSATGTVTVTLRNDSSGAPGLTILATASKSMSALSDGFVWERFSFSSLGDIGAAGTYAWILVTTTSMGDHNHIGVYVDDQGGYTSGVLKSFTSGGGWVEVTGKSMLFNAVQAEAPFAAMSSALTFSALSTYSSIVDFSGSNSVVTLDNFYLQTIDFLMREILQQASTGSWKYYYDITPYGVVKVYRAPTSANVPSDILWWVDSAGVWRVRGYTRLFSGKPPYGAWSSLTERTPVSAMLDRRAEFVEAVEYEPDKDRYRTTSSPILSDFDVVTVE